MLARLRRLQEDVQTGAFDIEAAIRGQIFEDRLLERSRRRTSQQLHRGRESSSADIQTPYTPPPEHVRRSYADGVHSQCGATRPTLPSTQSEQRQSPARTSLVEGPAIKQQQVGYTRHQAAQHIESAELHSVAGSLHSPASDKQSDMARRASRLTGRQGTQAAPNAPTCPPEPFAHIAASVHSHPAAMNIGDFKSRRQEGSGNLPQKANHSYESLRQSRRRQRAQPVAEASHETGDLSDYNVSDAGVDEASGHFSQATDPQISFTCVQRSQQSPEATEQPDVVWDASGVWSLQTRQRTAPFQSTVANIIDAGVANR